MIRAGTIGVWLTMAGLVLGAAPASAAEGGRDLTIRGTISISEALAASLRPDDRLILKIYHPGSDGFDKDTKYQIKPDFTLPTEFRIAPPIDMNANPRWPTYIVEIFTDRDHDVLSLVEGELFASTGQALTHAAIPAYLLATFITNLFNGFLFVYLGDSLFKGPKAIIIAVCFLLCGIQLPRLIRWIEKR